MPKDACKDLIKLQNYVAKYGKDDFSTDGKVLLCKLCSVKVNHTKKYFVEQHIKRSKHQQALALKNAPKTQTITTFLSGCDKNEFNSDLTRMLLACDIPLHKVNRPQFKTFMEKYAQKKVPDESTLRKNYVKDCYFEVLQQIRADVGDDNIFVSIDETTDKVGRCVTNVIVGPLRKDARGYLLTCEVLKKVNATTIATLFDDSLRLLWPDGPKREKVLLFVTDAAPYMKKSGKSLEVMYAKMIHVTCVAHGVHRVCETIRSHFPKVDALVSNMKKIFLKSASRIAFFKEKEPELPLPPQPVLTRWGTWLDAASYYAQYFSRIKAIIDELEDDACCVEFAKKLIAKETVQAQLAYFGFLVDPKEHIFKSLQKTGRPIEEVLKILKEIEEKLKKAKGPIAEDVTKKFMAVFSANEGLLAIKNINNIVNGAADSNFPPNIEVNDVTSFTWAPLVSAHVERSFSSFKALLRDNRRRLLPENFKMYMVVQCYYNHNNNV